MLGGLDDLLEVRVKDRARGGDREDGVGQDGVLGYERGGLEGRLGVVQESCGDLGLHNLSRGHLHGDPEVRGGGARRGGRPGDEGAQTGERHGGGGQADGDWDTGAEGEAEKLRYFSIQYCGVGCGGHWVVVVSGVILLVSGDGGSVSKGAGRGGHRSDGQHPPALS